MTTDEIKLRINAELSGWPDDEHAADWNIFLAHYTSISTFEQIISNNKIWLSNPLNMNDYEELRVGLNDGLNEFVNSEELKNSLSESEYQALITYFLSFYSHFENEYAVHTYIFCLSEHAEDNDDGLLSMWRGYGANGSGVAIVFDLSKVKENTDSPLIIRKVRYLTQNERLELIRSKISSLSRLLQTFKPSNDEIKHAAWTYFYYLKEFSLFTKHKGFSEEQEWRVVYVIERDINKIFHKYFDYFVSRCGIEPKLKLPVQPLLDDDSDDLSLEKIIHKVILGPTGASALALESTKQMLIINKKMSLADRVRASRIPFRSRE